jgi:putative transposase
LNRTGSIDLMSDALYRARRFLTLNVLDNGVREAQRIVIDTSIPSGRVVRSQKQIAAWRGYRKSLRLDNGPEPVSANLETWCAEHRIHLRFMEPG